MRPASGARPARMQRHDGGEGPTGMRMMAAMWIQAEKCSEFPQTTPAAVRARSTCTPILYTTVCPLGTSLFTLGTSVIRPLPNSDPPTKQVWWGELE
jgi:hypothetical protein